MIVVSPRPISLAAPVAIGPIIVDDDTHRGDACLAVADVDTFATVCCLARTTGDNAVNVQ